MKLPGGWRAAWRSGDDAATNKPWSPRRIGALIVAFMLVFLVGLGIYWSAEPGFIESNAPDSTPPPGEVHILEALKSEPSSIDPLGETCV